MQSSHSEQTLALLEELYEVATDEDSEPVPESMLFSDFVAKVEDRYDPQAWSSFEEYMLDHIDLYTSNRWS